MQFSNILIPVLLMILIWKAHVAGGAYILRKEDGIRIPISGHTWACVLLAVLIAIIAWK
jgi:H+/gluconate symporter-like permease